MEKYLKVFYFVVLQQLFSWIVPVESWTDLGSDEPTRASRRPRVSPPFFFFLINRFTKENVTCEVKRPLLPGGVSRLCPPMTALDALILPADWPSAIPLTADLLHHISTFLLLFQIIFPFILRIPHPPTPPPCSLCSAAGLYLTGNIPGDVARL